MTINSWVRLRNSDSGERGQVVGIARDKAGEITEVYVSWRDKMRPHAPEDLEVCE